MLKDINISVASGELLVVVGPVGCGKSTLLATILGESSLLSGSVRSRGAFALVEQVPTVFSASIKDNILFGKP